MCGDRLSWNKIAKNGVESRRKAEKLFICVDFPPGYFKFACPRLYFEDDIIEMYEKARRAKQWPLFIETVLLLVDVVVAGRPFVLGL